MIRGTTPTIEISTDVDLTGASVLYVTFAQGTVDVCEKTLSDVTVTTNKVTVTLTQEDTLAFTASEAYGCNPVYIQIRAKIGNTAIASNIMKTTADRILKNGVI